LNADLIRRVWERAEGRCEYCHLPSAFHPAPFQIDHIIARQHSGETNLENLALACIYCNRFKGPTWPGLILTPEKLFDCFIHDATAGAEHFVWDGPELRGRTQIGG
jgi:5-methylcytosine-specific restriction endonuclease McrA